jgi:hypothetical protein
MVADGSPAGRYVDKREKNPMPVIPFLRHRAFEPDLLQAMTAAFSEACRSLSLDSADNTDPQTERVARYIVELAQRGVNTQSGLYVRTMQDVRTMQGFEALA